MNGIQPDLQKESRHTTSLNDQSILCTLFAGPSFNMTRQKKQPALMCLEVYQSLGLWRLALVPSSLPTGPESSRYHESLLVQRILYANT